VSEWFLADLGGEPVAVRSEWNPPARFNVHSTPSPAALTLLQRRYTEPIDAETLANAVGISPRHLQRLF